MNKTRIIPHCNICPPLSSNVWTMRDLVLGQCPLCYKRADHELLIRQIAARRLLEEKYG